MKKYIMQILPVLSILSMFQSRIDLGKSLETILKYYELFREFIFKPIDLIGITLPEGTKNLGILLFTISIAFIVRGAKKNVFAVKGFIEGFVGGVIGFILVTISTKFLGGEELIGKMDDIGFSQLSVLEMILVAIVYILFALGLFFFANFQFWGIALLFPFIISLALKVPAINIMVILFSQVAIGNHKIFKIVAPSLYEKKFLVDYTADEVVENYYSTWTIKEYVDYYSPLKDLVISLLVVLLIFKIFVENFS